MERLPYADGNVSTMIYVLHSLINFGREQILQHRVSIITYDGYTLIGNLLVVYT
jgi:hypothetical protein